MELSVSRAARRFLGERSNINPRRANGCKGGIQTMSYGGNADPTGIQVTFLDQTGAKSVKAVIAFSVPVSRILPNIITKMNLPTTSPDGQPMSYSLDHKEGGRRLLENQTLVEASVQNGDHLIVYPEVVAGRR